MGLKQKTTSTLVGIFLGIEQAFAPVRRFFTGIYRGFAAFPKPARMAILGALVIGFFAQVAVLKITSLRQPKTTVAVLPNDVSPVAVEPVSIRDIQNTFSGHAILQAWKEVTLHPDAQVTIHNVNAKVGARVEKGQGLASVISESQALKNELEQLDMQLRELDYSVTLALAKKDFISKNERKQKTLEHRSQQIRARISALESNGRMVAPISGVVSEIQLKPGDYIDNSSNYYVKIVDPSQLKVSLYMPHTAAQKLTTESAVEFRRTESGDDGQDHEITAEGKVSAIAPVVDSKTGSVLVEVVLTKFPATWRPGLSVEASLALDLSASALVVPANAIVYQKGQPYIYRIKDVAAAPAAGATEIREPASDASGNPEGPTVERVAVKLGIRDATHVEVVEGLGEKDSIVIEGQGALANGAKVEIVR